jgi:hypothetical protein
MAFLYRLCALSGSPNANTDTAWQYFLSSLAQSLAAIAALVVALTLLAPQVASAYGPLMAGRTFNRGNLAKLVLFLVSIGLSLTAIHIPTLRLLAIESAGASACVLCWYFLRMGRSIDPNSAIEALESEQLAYIKSDNWGRLAPMSALHGFARVALARQELHVYRRAIGAAVHLSRCFLQWANEGDSARKDYRKIGARDFADSVFRKLRTQVLGLSDSPDAILCTIEEVGHHLNFIEVTSLDELMPRMTRLCEAAGHVLPWPEQEQTVADIIDLMGSHVLTPFGLSGEMRDDGQRQRVELLGLALSEAASRIVSDATSRSLGRSVSGFAWASLVRFMAHGVMDASFHKGDTRMYLARMYGEKAVQLLCAPPAGAHTGLQCQAHLDVTLMHVTHASLLPDNERLCPRLPAFKDADLLLINDTFMLIRAFAMNAKPRLLAAALSRIAAGGDWSGRSKLLVAQLDAILNLDCFDSIVRLEQQGGPLGAAVTRVVAAALPREDRTSAAAFLAKLIERIWPTGSAALGFNLFEAAEVLRERGRLQHDVSEDDRYAWFLAGAFWFKDKTHPVAAEAEVLTVQQRLRNQWGGLDGILSQGVMTRIKENPAYVPALSLFCDTMGITLPS